MTERGSWKLFGNILDFMVDDDIEEINMKVIHENDKRGRVQVSVKDRHGTKHSVSWIRITTKENKKS